MPTAQQDTEITLGTGRMLAIFFAFVLVCAVFFSIGFSLGRRTTAAVSGISQSGTAATPAAIVRPSAGKNDAPQATPQSPSQSQTSDFSFYKAVGEKNANTAMPTQGSTAQTATPNASAITPVAPASATTATSPPPAVATGAYYVQVAAVTRQEDANALVEALRKKQYPAFTADTTTTDRFYRVQIGPYADLKDAEAMRTRLIGDGYNPIVKK
jgi:cell division septation protein DedD